MEQTQVLSYMVMLSVMDLAMEEEGQALIQGFTFFTLSKKLIAIWIFGVGIFQDGTNKYTKLIQKCKENFKKQ